MSRVDELLAEAKANGNSQPSRVDQLLAEAKSGGEASLGGFASGIGSYIADTIGNSPKWGFGQAINATRDAWQNLTANQQESIAEYAPAAAITAASTLIPGGWATQAAVNLAANSAINGIDASRHGESVVSAMNPLNHPVETLLGVAVPAAVEGIGAIGRGISSAAESRAARAVDDVIPDSVPVPDSPIPAEPRYVEEPILPRAMAPRPQAGDLEAALRLDAPLRPLPEIPKLPEAVADDATEAAASAVPDAAPAPMTPGDVVPSARDRLGALADRAREERDFYSDAVGWLRSGLSRPARYLSRAEGEGARVAGFRLEDLTHTEQRLRENALRMIADAFGDMDLAGRQEVTRLLDGSQAVSSRADVTLAATRMRDFYDQWANLAEREGLLTKELIDDDMLGQGGFIYRPFKRIGKDYSPRIAAEDSISRPLRDKLRGVFRKDTVSHARTALEPNPEIEYLTDALDIAKTYTDDYAKKIAIARTFGSDIGEPLAGKPWGQKAKDILAVLEQEGDPYSREMFKATMDRLYSGQSEPWAQALSDVNARVTSSMLGGSWATQLGQAATPIRQYGLGNTIEGLVRYYRDPSLRALIDASGVRDAGYANFVAQGAGDLATAPIRAIGKVEKFLRGPMNAGVVPYLEGIADRVAAAGGEPLTRGMQKQLEELLLTPERLRSEGLTYNLLKDAIQASGRRTQFHAGTIGQTGNAFLTPGMKQMFSLQPFGWSAWTSLQDDVLEPLLSRNSDASLRLLGASRLGRMVPAALAAESARELLASGIRVHEPNRREIIANAFGTQGGTPGQLLGGQFLNQAVDPRFNFIPPIVGMPLSVLSDLGKGNFGKAAVNVASVFDPTGYTALARPTLLGLLSQMKSDDRRKKR